MLNFQSKETRKVHQITDLIFNIDKEEGLACKNLGRKRTKFEQKLNKGPLKQLKLIKLEMLKINRRILFPFSELNQNLINGSNNLYEKTQK